MGIPLAESSSKATRPGLCSGIVEADNNLPDVLSGSSGRSAIAPAAAARTAAPPVASGRPRTSLARLVVEPPVMSRGRRRHIRQRRHSRRINHYMPKWPGACALTAQPGLVAEGDMQHAPLAAVHRIKPERRTGVLHLFSGRTRAHAQLFDPERAIVVGIEGNPRVI